MAMIHRLQWIDAEIRADRHPNTKSLAERFEISRRQALRDFEYLRDSLGAPLDYSAKCHGYYYTSDTYILPGPFVTEEERRLLHHLQSYYSKAAEDEAPGSGAYAQMADLMQKLGGITRETPSKGTRTERSSWELPSPYRATILLPSAISPQTITKLEPHIVSHDDGETICEFREWEQFLDLLMGLREPMELLWPIWLRERLTERLSSWLERQREISSSPSDGSAMPPASLVSEPSSPTQMGITFSMQRSVRDRGSVTTTFLPSKRELAEIKMVKSNSSYLGALYGVLVAAGMCDLSFDLFAAQTGRAFHFSLHGLCHPSSISVYNWTSDHRRAVDLIGVFTQVITFEPHFITYPAACKRVVSSIKQGLNRGFGAVLWGVDGGEFGIIKGYDDADGVFLTDGVGQWQTAGTSTPILYDNIGRTFNVPILHCQIPIEQVEYNHETCQRVTLGQYVQSMETPTLFDADYYYGLSAYQVWDTALRSRNFNQVGLRYVTGYYAEAKRQMATYIRHVASSVHLSGGVIALYDQLALTYRKMLTDVLEQEMSIWGERPKWKPLTPAQADAMAALVREAHRVERQGIAGIKKRLQEDESKSGYLIQV